MPAGHCATWVLPGTAMTLILTASAWLSAILAVLTCALLAAPVIPGERLLWRRLRIPLVRRWITRRRQLSGVLDFATTPLAARRNLRWHLGLTSLFAAQLAMAAGSRETWWRPLVALLVLPSVGYFVGSLVQRQKIAILHAHDVRARAGAAV